MQGRVLYEMVADGDEVENIFQEDLMFSNEKYLPIGQATFRSCLGKTYWKRHSLKKAGEMLKNAK